MENKSIKIMILGISIILFGGFLFTDPAKMADITGIAALVFGLAVVVSGFFTKDR